MFKIGDQVISLRNWSVLGITSGMVGIVFEDYKTGVQVIFENGEYCGFGNDEYNFLRKIGHKNLDYKFENVVQLRKDFDAGKFADFLKLCEHRDISYEDGSTIAICKECSEYVDNENI